MVGATAAGGQPSDLRLRLDFEFAKRMPRGPRGLPPGGDLMPQLRAPEGVAMTGQSGGGSESHWTSDTTVQTDQPVAALEAHFAAQLAESGWTRVAGAADEVIAWSAWQVPDPDGEDWRGLLLVLAPFGTTERSLTLRLDKKLDPTTRAAPATASRSPGSSRHPPRNASDPAVRRGSMRLYAAAGDADDDDAAEARRQPPSPEELCALYADRVYHFATMIARDDVEADDLAQTALEKALRALPRYQPERGSLDAWLWRIVVNAARDAGRAASRRHLLTQRLAGLRDDREPADDIPAGVTDGVLVAAVRRLTPLQRSAIALRFGADLEYRDVGAALRISPVAARVATHRALTALRGSLQIRKDS
jgi:RNA polymerase sigma-70 factor (ECF subfamily)